MKPDMGTTGGRPSGRAGGRATRVAARTAATSEINPCQPGQTGGQYAPLKPHEVSRITDTAFKILAEIGMAEVPDKLRQQALAKGAEISGLGRLTFSRAMMEDIIDKAAKTITLFGRDPAHDIEIGGEKVYYGTGGAAVQTLDPHTGKYRGSTLKDLYDFTRLADQLENISWFTRCCVATDIPDNFDLDINTGFALLAGTAKPVGTSFTLGEYVEPVINMFDIALGGDGSFKKRPFCKAHISPVISPLRYGEDAFDVALECIRLGVPINAIIAAQSGATAPAAPAGMLAHTLAETMAGLAMVNLFAPGYPVIFSNWPFVIDLRSGAFSGSGGEISMMNAAAAQLSNHLGLPSGVASSMADAKAPDAQMGAEKALSATVAGLSGANLIYESSGMMASLLGVSFEAFVLDNEMLSNIHRVIRGIEVNDETLGFDSILQTVTGEGHFLGSDSTLAAMQRDYYYPKLANMDTPAVWNESGAPDILASARETSQKILSTHYPSYLSSAAQSAIRDRYNILLPASAMQA